MQNILEIHIEDRRPFAIVRLAGAMSKTDVLTLKACTLGLLNMECAHIVLDISSLAYIDSVGVGVIALLRSECSKANGSLSIVRVKGSAVAQVLGAASIDKIVEFYSSAEEAIRLVRESLAANRPPAQNLAAAKIRLDAPPPQTGMALAPILARLDRLERRLDAAGRLMIDDEADSANRPNDISSREPGRA
ncbi:MAG: putative anti-sigma factor antagonist [candidate division BRC1 bacterium ADurb.BinA364]|nr:MAG: putative anti-sigma factor antagonist [candidate division BRC1 bacterium ADurb.BinA364]